MVRLTIVLDFLGDIGNLAQGVEVRNLPLDGLLHTLGLLVDVTALVSHPHAGLQLKVS